MNRSNCMRHRSKVLTAAIVAALALGTTGTAVANSAYTLGGVQTLTLQDYLQTIANQQVLAAPVSASVTGNQVGYIGPASAGALTVSGNTVQALTLNFATNVLGANGADNAISLGLLGVQNESLPPGDVNQGIGILSGQLAAAGVTTLLDNANIGLDVIDYTVGDATVTGNALNATTLVNGASNRATGGLNTTPFSSTAPGHVSLDYAPTGASMDATGGVTIGNAQIASNADSSAQVTDSNISLVNAMTGPAGSSAPVTVASNTINAADTVNRGDNRFVAAAGGAVSYAGSVGVVNGQANVGGSHAATVSGTAVGAELDGTAYAGRLSVTGNTMSASAQGNDAAAVDANGNLMRGNVISFADGIDVAGSSSDASLGLSFGSISGTTATTGTADGSLALLSSQGNQGGTISGTIQDSRIVADVATLNGGNLTASANHATASAGGNSAINLVSARGAAFEASVAAGNQQANDSTAISAAATDVTVGVQTGHVSATSTATVADSSIGASVSGNAAQTVVDVGGSYVAAGPASPVSADGGIGSGVSLDAGTAGIAVGNLQANFGAGTMASAIVENANLGILYDYSRINHGGAEGNSRNNTMATVTGNALSAAAGGNSASTAINASGTIGTLTASLVSGQYNANDIQATVDQSAGGMLGIADNGYPMVWGGKPGLDIALTVTDNVINANASANQSANSLTTDFDSSLTLAGGGTGLATDAATGTNHASSALSLLNDQVDDTGNVGSLVEGARTGLDISRSEFVAYTVSDNATSARAIGNSTTNGLTVSAGNLVRAGSGAVASLGNLQQMGADSIALISDSSIGSIQEGNRDSIYGTNNYALSLTSAVTGNTLSAVAKGNVAAGVNAYGNTLTASGTNLVDAGTAPSAAFYGADGQTAAGAFILQSNQSSTAGTRSATVADGFIGNRTNAYFSGNLMSVSDNMLNAEASDNYASNRLGLDFANLATTAMLQNAQQSMATMESTVSNAEIGVDAAANMGKDSVTVTDNTVDASAVANAAASRLDLTAAGSLGGNAADASAFGVPAGYRGAASSAASGIMVLADYGLVNAQSRNGGDVDASIQTAKLGVFAGGYFDERDLSPYTTSNNDGTAAISGNAASALAQGNSSDSRLVLDAGSIDATAAIYSRQLMDSNVSATAADIDIGLRAGGMSLTGPSASPLQAAVMPITVTGNTVDSSARLNDAVNVLSVTADNTVAGSGGDVGASNDTGRFDGFAGAVADFAVANEQSSNSNAMASLASVTVGIFSGSTVLGGSAISIGSAAGQSSLTVSENSLAAQASGNTATNGALLDAAASMSASVALNNDQALTAGAIASDVNDVAVASGNRAGATGSITSTNLTTTGNEVSGSASGNSASNAISVQGVALNGMGMSAEGAINGIAGTSTAIANYALNSVQKNDAVIGSAMASISIGTNVVGGVGALTNSTATVGNNRVLGSASGNSASNSIALASATGMPSASLVSSQVNTAAVGSMVNNVRIGVIAGGLPGLSNSPVAVTGNSIIASAAGNSAINQIGVGK